MNFLEILKSSVGSCIKGVSRVWVYKSIYIELKKPPLLPPTAAKKHQNRIEKPILQIMFGGAGKKFFHQTATLLPPKYRYNIINPWLLTIC